MNAKETPTTLSQETPVPIVETAAEQQPQVVVEAEPLPAAANLQEAMQREGEETTPVNPEEIVANIDASLEETNLQIAALEERLKTQGGRLAEVKASLGMTGETEKTVDARQLETLLAEKAEKEKEKEEAEMMEDLEKVLEAFAQLTPEERRKIVETGMMPDGKDVMSPRGKVSPEVAKSLAQAAEDGTTKITKALLKGIFSIAKGILKGIFQAIKETVAGN